MDGSSNIETPGRPESLYDFLQEQSLDSVQRMAGKIWTDYNLHDPGVTTLDILNYALFEWDYRLSFPLQDYLTTAERAFIPERYGLFGADAVYSMNPVTPDDYRALLLDRIDEIEDVKLKIHPPVAGEESWGCYDLFVELSPFIEPERQQAEKKRIRKILLQLYHSRRNLGENLYGIYFIQREKLILTGDIETDGSVKPEDMLFSIYAEALVLFSSEKNEDTQGLPVYRLYQKIKQLRGVTGIRSLDLKETERKGPPYTIAISNEADIQIRLFRQGKPSQANTTRVMRRLQARNNLHRVSRTKKAAPGSAPLDGQYHDMSHTSIQNDFPECYGLGFRQTDIRVSDEHRIRLRQFKAYLLLFDLFLAKGLEEVQQLAEWMELNTCLAEEKTFPFTIPETVWKLFIDEKTIANQRPGAKREAEQNKHRLLDMLDRLYGKDSNPGYVRLKDPAANLERRVRFLKQLPELLRRRYNGIDLQDAASVSGLEQYLTTFLGLDLAGQRVYVVEHLLLSPSTDPETVEEPIEVIDHDPADPAQLPMEFTLSILFPVCDGPADPAQFQLGVEELLSECVPAHIRFDSYWLTAKEMTFFSRYYAAWRQAWANGSKKERDWTAGTLAGCLAELKNRSKK